MENYFNEFESAIEPEDVCYNYCTTNKCAGVYAARRRRYCDGADWALNCDCPMPT